MSPHQIINIDDESGASTASQNENCSPTSPSDSHKPKSRILYCRKCEGHGEKVILKNHSPQCPYILCNCKSCEKLNYKRLKSFNKRNKDKIELAAALNAKRHATSETISSFDDEDQESSRRSSFSSKTSSPGMDSDNNASSSSSGGLEGRSMSLGAMTVMSYDIWKAKCASEKKRLEEEKAKKEGSTEPKRSPSPVPIRKRAHTFVAQPRVNRTEDIPVVASKKMSVDEKGKGKYILLPTIPAMRILVDAEEDKKPIEPVAASVSVAPVTATTPVAAPPATTAPVSRPFQLPASLPRPSPVVANPTISPLMSPFKPIAQQPPTPIITSVPQPNPLGNLSTEQIISSLTLHNTILQQQQNSQMMQDLITSLASGVQPSVDVLSMLRIQQQAAALTAQLQAQGITLPASIPKTPLSIPVATSANLLSSFLQPPVYSNPV
ncbi:unnamed protein product [Caenorhabditis bovis]|uniref:DM domain-containing protein n=1 Tax=Caenorhabditis bovis TaxID=2654633 RepID=A0A8S1EXP5_9PELO|nr:unnamed protein product [Caenorhabditis bovis]